MYFLLKESLIRTRILKTTLHFHSLKREELLPNIPRSKGKVCSRLHKENYFVLAISSGLLRRKKFLFSYIHFEGVRTTDFQKLLFLILLFVFRTIVHSQHPTRNVISRNKRFTLLVRLHIQHVEYFLIGYSFETNKESLRFVP